MSNSLSKPYQPISCSFYDELEALATLKQIVKITFFDDNKQQQTIRGKIINLYTKEKVEFLEIDKGLTIRLDKLVKVGDKALRNYC